MDNLDNLMEKSMQKRTNLFLIKANIFGFSMNKANMNIPCNPLKMSAIKMRVSPISNAVRTSDIQETPIIMNNRK